MQRQHPKTCEIYMMYIDCRSVLLLVGRGLHIGHLDVASTAGEMKQPSYNTTRIHQSITEENNSADKYQLCRTDKH